MHKHVAILWFLFGVLAVVGMTYVGVRKVAAPPEPPPPTPPCSEYLFVKATVHGETCPVGAVATKLDDTVIVCRCDAAAVELVEGASRE